MTYRLGDHTTADDASRYRDPEELKEWELRDPIVRLRRYLERNGHWDSAQEEVLQDEARSWVDAQVEEFEAMSPQEPGDIFAFMYAEPTPILREQSAALLEEVQS